MAFDQKVSDDEFAKAFDDDDDRGVSLGRISLGWSWVSLPCALCAQRGRGEKGGSRKPPPTDL